MNNNVFHWGKQNLIFAIFLTKQLRYLAKRFPVSCRHFWGIQIPYDLWSSKSIITNDLFWDIALVATVTDSFVLLQYSKQSGMNRANCLVEYDFKFLTTPDATT